MSCFEASIAFAKMGGTIDFTASEDPDFWEREDDEVRFSKGLKTFVRRRYRVGSIHHDIGWSRKSALL